jgi:hypothetical protein
VYFFPDNFIKLGLYVQVIPEEIAYFSKEFPDFMLWFCLTKLQYKHIDFFGIMNDINAELYRGDKSKVDWARGLAPLFCLFMRASGYKSKSIF